MSADPTPATGGSRWQPGPPAHPPLPDPAAYRPTRRRTGCLIAGIVVAGLVVAAGALAATAGLARHTLTQDHTYRHAIDLIIVDVGSGDVDLSAGDAGQATVHRRLTWSWFRPTVIETWDGNTLSLRYRCHGVFLAGGCGVDYRLSVPAGVAVDVRTGSGDIHIRDLTGPLTLHSGSGDLAVSHAGGRLSLNTGSGDVNAAGLTATSVRARTGSGDVALRFDGAPSDVAADTGSGDVRVFVPSGPYRVSTRTGSGEVALRVATDPEAPAWITVQTGSGDITIARP